VIEVAGHADGDPVLPLGTGTKGAVSSPGSMTDQNEASIVGSTTKNSDCGHVLASHSGVIVHPASTPQVASGSPSIAGNVIDVRPKQATQGQG